MKISLAGGNDTLQRSVTEAMVARGHRVRLLGDHAPALAGEWPAQVEPYGRATAYSLLEDSDLAVVFDESACPHGRHARTSPIEVIREAERQKRLGDVIMVTAIRGASFRASASRASRPIDGPAHAFDTPQYSRSLRLLLRTTPIYGIDADPVSTFLIMMRSLPVVPLLSDSYTLQPLWHRDLAEAIATTVSQADRGRARALDRRVQDIGGPDVVTSAALYEGIAALIDRRPLRVPVPHAIASYGARLTEALHLPASFDVASLGFVDGGGRAPLADPSTLSSVFDVVPTGLDRGLHALISELNEVTPDEGVGTLEVKRFSVDIQGAAVNARELLALFRRRFRDVMPIAIGVEPAAPETGLDEGTVVTMALPGRGHVQVRVEDVGEEHVIVATLRGHALAGIARFAAHDLECGVRFEVMLCDTAANALDWLTRTLGAARAHDANWKTVAQNVAKLAGGDAGEVQADERRLHGGERETFEWWIRDIIRRQRATRHAPDAHRTGTHG